MPVLQGVRLSTAQCLTTVEDREKMSVIPYASAIGSIMYAMLCTRPDVNLVVSLVARWLPLSLSRLSIKWSLGDPYDVSILVVCLLGSDEFRVYDQLYLFISMKVI